MSTIIHVIAAFQCHPGRADAVVAAARPCVEASRLEAGCLRYTLTRDPRHEDRFVFVERWASRAALGEHERTEHFKALGQALASLLAGPLDLTLLDEVIPE